MSSWTLLHALTGILYSKDLYQFSIAPKINATDFKSFFITNSAWGIVKLQVLEEKIIFLLTISFGELILKSIRLELMEEIASLKIQSCKLINSKDEISINTKADKKNIIIEVSLPKSVVLKESQRFQVDIKITMEKK
jgi:hypothetical protein